MAEHSQIKVSGVVRTDLDVDLIAQLVIMLGHLLAQEASGAETEPGEPPSCVTERSA